MYVTVVCPCATLHIVVNFFWGDRGVVVGFENFGHKNNLEQLLINYANESLQGDFNHQVGEVIITPAAVTFFIQLFYVCVNAVRTHGVSWTAG